MKQREWDRLLRELFFNGVRPTARQLQRLRENGYTASFYLSNMWLPYLAQYMQMVIVAINALSFSGWSTYVPLRLNDLRKPVPDAAIIWHDGDKHWKGVNWVKDAPYPPVVTAFWGSRAADIVKEPTHALLHQRFQFMVYASGYNQHASCACIADSQLHASDDEAEVFSIVTSPTKTGFATPATPSKMSPAKKAKPSPVSSKLAQLTSGRSGLRSQTKRARKDGPDESEAEPLAKKTKTATPSPRGKGARGRGRGRGSSSPRGGRGGGRGGRFAVSSVRESEPTKPLAQPSTLQRTLGGRAKGNTMTGLYLFTNAPQRKA